MISHDGSLVLQVDKPEVILQAIRTARLTNVNGKQLLVVPHHADEVKILRNLGLEPPPIKLQFNYTGRFKPMEHQQRTVEFLVVNKRAFNLSDMGCVDCETEYLTPTGWRRIDSYTEGELVAQYNVITKQAEYVKPIGYIKLPCDRMLRFKTSRGIDQKLSDEHRVLYVNTGGALRVITAREVSIAMDSLKMGWKGRFLATFKPAVSTGIELTNEELRVQIAVIADGYFGSGTTYCIVRLKKDRKKQRLREILIAANIVFEETMPEYESAPGFSIFKFYAPLRLKHFDKRFWHATEEQLHIIASELHHWDGSEKKAEGIGFYTGVKESADFAQYAYATTGRTAALHTYKRETYNTEYVVHARDNDNPLWLVGCDNNGIKVSNITEELATDGFKYCFAVPSTYLILRRNGCIFITGNTGKTASALWASEFLRQKGKIRRVLIACPLSVVSVWEEECFNIVPHRSFARLVGTRQKRLDMMAHGSDICVINHDGIATIAKEIIQAKFDLYIIDEASSYRNAQTKKFKTLREIIKPQHLWLWPMTGTPAPKAPTDAYALVKMLNPGSFPGGFTLWKELTMTKVTQFKWVPKADSKEFVYKYLKPAIRYKKEDCIDLPPLTYVTRNCDLTEQQRKAFQLMKARMVAEKHDGERITAANAAVKLIKLVQICCGVVKDNNGVPYKLDTSERLNTLEETIEQAGGKVIVFVPFIGVMDMVQKFLKEKGYNIGLVNGSVTERHRATIFDEFQRGDMEILIAHPQTTAHGLNLTASNTIIWYAPIFSVEQYLQANNRINRPGQTQHMTIAHIVSTPLEAGLYRGLWGKVQLQAELLKQYEDLLQ